MKILLVLVGFITTTSVMGLEMDEKLTLRFLKVSNSKKTILINRGAEDGVAVGDHAKFFITSGVIARGVVEKVSPSRSIWSLYRVVDPAEIVDGKVLNLKIATPVKITSDPTKSMKEEEIPAGNDSMSITGEEEATDTETPAVSADEQKELEGMGLEEVEVSAKAPPKVKKSNPTTTKSRSKEATVVEDLPVYGRDSSKNWEIWAMLYANALSGTVDTSAPDTDTVTTNTKLSSFDYSVGLEKYFLTSDSFLRNLSLSAFIHKKTLEPSDSVSNDWTEFGGGANYHFYNEAATLNRLIGYGGVNMGVGTSSLSTTTNNETTTTKGSSTFYALGLGTKYVLSNGFGARAVLEYYHTEETFNFEGDTKRTYNLAGPRILFGLSYRF